MSIKSKRCARKFCLFVVIAAMITLFSPFWPANINTVSAASLTSLRILEVQPSTAYDISDTTKLALQTYLGRTIELTQMPMPLFISKVDQINGYYDIVYIGNNGNAKVDYKDAKADYTNYFKGTTYTQFGPVTTFKPNYSASVANDKEFYSGTDITDITSANLQSFIDSKQLVVFDEGIFAPTMSSTKLYENFIGYKQGYTNVKVGSTSSLLNNLKAYTTTSGIMKRPDLEITKNPEQYNGTNGIANNGVISFAMNIQNVNSSDSMTVKLFVDKNGDGIFQDAEKVSENGNVLNTQGYSINYLLSKSFTGIVPWKIEVTDNKSRAKSYQTGFTANKGDELHIRVLQLMPSSGCTLHLTDLANKYNKNFLYKQGEYRIDVTEMLSSDFDNSYRNGNNKVVLNGNYDMVIFGFGDCYTGGDLRQTAALQAVKDFANSGQSIMFTHDTIGFNTAGDNLTTWFKGMLGLNAFATDATKPSGVSVSSGMTRLALLNPNSVLSRFPDTVKTHKINESNLTRYPYILNDIGVSVTHLQYLRLNMEDPNVETAFTYRNDVIYNHGTRTPVYAADGRTTSPETLYHEYDGANDYYTFFRGNLTYSGTGHSPITSEDEYKMFINTILKASVGSNHAPVVQIHGLTDGQNIANTLQTLDFSVLASDYEDKYLTTGTIIIDKNNDGIYNEAPVETFDAAHPLTSDIEKAFSETKGVANSVSRFGIQVQVKDSEGATGTCEIHINNVSTPTLTINNNAGNYLVGDTANVDLSVNALAASALITTYNDLRLSTTLNTSAFTSVTATGWTNEGSGKYTKTLSNVGFNPQPDNINQIANLSFVCATVGTTNVTAQLDYAVDFRTGSNKVVNSNFNIGVNEGTVNVEVKDNFGQVISNKPVTLKKYTDATGTTIDSTFIRSNVNTNATGIAKFTNVPTGYYGATFVLPTGYNALGNARAGSIIGKMADGILDYNNNTRLITLPALYQPGVVVINEAAVRVWEKLQLTTTITPAIYQSYPVTWSVTRIPGDKGNATIDIHGILVGKSKGKVMVAADTNRVDLNGDEIIGYKVIDINATAKDID